ncbi:sulfatase-like hydrolase/transferase [Leifsonia sp. 2MCAF36]|uniref:sulfatase-like hydrolase/transferase n=1 Tax=Leifsonia sp. 2MCAF36 TaxID=3232988 RepID=UPI003F9D0E09
MRSGRRRPNIVWISTHDINPDLGCYTGVWPGAEYAVTPHLDALASRGIRFDNAFAAAPICAPSRSAIITGCFPTAIGTMHMRSKAVLPPTVRLLPEIFRQAGYYCTNNWFTDFQIELPDIAFDDCSPTAHWRNRPDEETPFFAVFHGMATHESQLYLDDEAFSAATSHVSEADRHDPAAAPLPPYYPDEPAFRNAWARYSDLITEMDHWAGGIIAQLEADGLLDDTIVVFWSDHGKGMPRAKRWPNESGLREPLIVSWPGRFPAGVSATGLVHTMDLAPTMLRLAGLDVPAAMHGVPLFDSDDALIAEPNAYTYGGRDRQGEAEDRSRTVRDRRFRYIRNDFPDKPAMIHTEYPDHLATWAAYRRLASHETQQRARGERPSLMSPLQRSVVAQSKPAEELYDIVADPHETNNLAADPAYAADLIRLREALAGWIDRFGDLGMQPEAELEEAWRPGGVRRRTAQPNASVDNGVLTMCSETPGAILGWTTEEARGPAETASPLSEIGITQTDGRSWHPYDEPIAVDSPIWVKAWRVGYEPSPELLVTARATNEPSR